MVSEHLAWSRVGEICLPDLLPVPRTNEALRCLTRNIDQTQKALGRRILVENPSHYIPLPDHDWDEPSFLCELVRRTGCGLLIDMNNVWVSANNLGFSPQRYIDALPFDAIEEIHIAGHRPDAVYGDALLIDSHDAPVAEPVWRLLARLVSFVGRVPVLLERDGDIPPFFQLLAERNRAANYLANCREFAHAC